MNDVAIGIWQFVGSLALLYLAYCVVYAAFVFVRRSVRELRERHCQRERTAWYDQRPWIERP